MKQYLIDFFKYNDWANRQLIAAIRQLPDTAEPVKLVSHIITSQNKWLNRITHEVDDKSLTWYDQIFPLDQLENRWSESLNHWLELLDETSAVELEKDIIFERPTDNKKLSVKMRDIALQLNYHSIHHRAQVNRIIRQEGFKPPATDYIVTVLKEL